MGWSRFRFRLTAWLGVGVLLAACTVAVWLFVNVATALGLGAILFTVYSGSLIFIQQDRTRDTAEHRIKKPEPEAMESDRDQPKEDESGPVSDPPDEEISFPLVPWQAAGGKVNYSWHPALNEIEDTLAGQISDPSVITDVIERVGMNPGIIPRGHGTAATLWHGALRQAWMTGREERICEILCQASKLEPSDEIQRLIGAYCVKRQRG